jgi:hypothetical protein
MLIRRFFIAWIVASVTMFILFYVLHGIILNDFTRLNYPKSIFLVFSAFTYLIIGFIVVKMVDVDLFDKFFKHRQLLKGVLAGMVCGAFLFLIAKVIGVSFSNESNLRNLVFDLGWQMIEQGVGGGVVSLVFVFVRVF